MTNSLPTAHVLDRSDLDALLACLWRRGYRVIGPTLRDDAIVYDELPSSAQLPIGWTDRQEAGRYRLERRRDQACFGYVVGPQSYKRTLSPPAIRLFRARLRSTDGEPSTQFVLEQDVPEPVRYAFFGVRACELAAMHVQDRVFLGDVVDPVYAHRRSDNFIVAVQCAEAGGTCFCDSMQTGPRAERGFDLALTELLSSKDHRFLLEVGSEQGRSVVEELPTRPAERADLLAAQQASERARQQMGRVLDTAGVAQLLKETLEHPHWDDVAGRCESCANCTLVCPTCFCHTVEDTIDVKGEHAERWRLWDSCFNADFSYIHGGHIRSSTRSRYRQWLTHKLSTWHDQFGSSGCVGCGRCITWCPVGIDLTEEIAALRRKEPPT